MKPYTKTLLSRLNAALLILLFVYTATSKLMDMVAFHNTIAKFPLLDGYSFIISRAIPISELIISIWLTIPASRLLGFYASTVLLFLFTIYLGYVLLTSSNLPCGCGGVFTRMSWPQHLFLNLIFIGISISGVLIERKLKLLISRSSRIPVVK